LNHWQNPHNLVGIYPKLAMENGDFHGLQNNFNRILPIAPIALVIVPPSMRAARMTSPATLRTFYSFLSLLDLLGLVSIQNLLLVLKSRTSAGRLWRSGLLGFLLLPAVSQLIHRMGLGFH
jgi:hypothetical protein